MIHKLHYILVYGACPNLWVHYKVYLEEIGVIRVEYDFGGDNFFRDESLKSDISEAVRDLSAIEAEVVSSKFGLDTGREKTLVNIGKDLGMERTEVKNIEQRAIRKLRNPHTISHLRPYLEK